MLNNYSYFQKNDIIFYPKDGNNFTVKTREKTRVVAVFRDYWDLNSSNLTWTLFMNYPKSSEFPNKELLIADGIDYLGGAFNYKDLDSVQGQIVVWT